MTAIIAPGPQPCGGTECGDVSANAVVNLDRMRADGRIGQDTAAASWKTQRN